VITLAGHQNRSVIRDVFARADMFVSPTIAESFGIAALEARSAGLPVVAMLQAGVSEFIHHGEEGLLARSDREMVDHVVTLATDDGLRSAIAQHNGETPGPATNWRHVTAQHLALYRKARELVPAPVRVEGVAVQASSISPASLRD
jgi:glycosyltransferase involved in cell wall biosynthesis